MQKLFFIGLIALLSCNSNEIKDKDFSTTKSKFHFKIIKAQNQGDSILTGNIVKVHLQQFIDDSLMNNTYNTMPVYVKIDSSLRQFDFSEILPMMKLYDSAVCIFPISELLKRASAETYPPDFLNRGKNIKVNFKIVDKFTSDSLAQNDFLVEQRRSDSMLAIKEKVGYDRAIKSFDSLIKSINQPLKKLPNGVYVQIMQSGTGAKIKTGEAVAVVYKGMLPNGTMFEQTTKQKPYVLKAGEGEAVEGFDSGIASLTFGDRAKIFIPAKLAYGPNPAGDKIPAFANLIFEVEVYPK